MAFSFFTKNIQGEAFVLLIDIGSASVGCALVKMGKGQVPHVLATVRQDVSFQESLSSTKFLLATNHALERALKALQSTTRSFKAPTHIFCTLSSPWFILKSRHIRIDREKPFEINEQVLDGFINEDIEQMKDELKETLPPKDAAVIEKKVIQVKLNGYDIKNPYGQTTSHLELITNIGVSSARVIQSFERKISQFFHAPLIHFGTFPFAAFSTVRDIFPTEKSFILLDVTGEATDVSLVVNDLLVGAVSFPRGKNYFIRELSANFKTLHEEAATLFGMYLRDELSDEKQLQVKNVITQAETEWLTRFEKAVSMLANNGALPHKAFFTTDVDIAPLFSKLIGEFKTELLFSEPFDVQYLDQLIVARFVSFETGVMRDPFIATEVLLVEKIISQN